jgi:hypothetical protein
VQGTVSLQTLTKALQGLAVKLLDMAENQAISKLFGNLGFLGFGSGGTASTASAGSGLGSAAGAVQAHTGGLIGSDYFIGRNVHSAYFDDAPRFHTGGMVGDDEVPIIAKNGEGVFTAAQMKALAPTNGGGGTSISVTIPQNITFYNADPASEARMRAYVDASHRQAVQTSVKAVQDVQRRTGGKYLSGGG